MSLAGATQDEVRRHNLAALVRFLHDHGSTSRSELVSHTGLNRSTVGGLHRPTSSPSASSARPSRWAAASGRPSFGVEPVHGPRLRARDRPAGRPHHRGARRLRRRRARTAASTATARASSARRGSSPSCVDVCHELLAEAPPRARCMVGVGVGVPGLVRQPDGLVRFAPNLGWVDVPLGDHLARRARGLDARSSSATTPTSARSPSGMRGARDRRGQRHLPVRPGRRRWRHRRRRSSSSWAPRATPARSATCASTPRGGRAAAAPSGCWETEIGEPAVRLSTGSRPTALGDRDRRRRRCGRRRPPDGPAHGGHLARRRVWPTWSTSSTRTSSSSAAPCARSSRPRGTHVRGRARPGRPHARPAEHVVLALPALGDDSTLLGAAESAFAPAPRRPARCDRGRLAPSRGLAGARGDGPPIPERGARASGVRAVTGDTGLAGGGARSAAVPRLGA